jgi:hypothetical protein
MMKRPIDLSKAIGEFLLRQVQVSEQEYVVKPVIPYVPGDKLVHTQRHPICKDETCPCKQQQKV